MIFVAQAYAQLIDAVLFRRRPAGAANRERQDQPKR